MVDKGKEKIWLSAAESFRQVSIASKEAIPPGQITVGAMIPVVVNAAFSAELYIKFILYKQGWKRKKADRHDLKNLFYQIRGELGVYIIEAIQQKYDEQFPEMNFDLDDALERHKNVFQEWRYLHEFLGTKKDLGIDYGFMLNFSGILKAVADNFEF